VRQGGPLFAPNLVLAPQPPFDFESRRDPLGAAILTPPPLPPWIASVMASRFFPLWVPPPPRSAFVPPTITSSQTPWNLPIRPPPFHSLLLLCSPDSGGADESLLFPSVSSRPPTLTFVSQPPCQPTGTFPSLARKKAFNLFFGASPSSFTTFSVQVIHYPPKRSKLSLSFQTCPTPPPLSPCPCQHHVCDFFPVSNVFLSFMPAPRPVSSLFFDFHVELH